MEAPKGDPQGSSYSLADLWDSTREWIRMSKCPVAWLKR